jgi:hypothetical protein
VHTTCLVCFISIVNGCSKKEKKPNKTGAGSGQITNPKQSILETFDIYELTSKEVYKTEAGLLNIQVGLKKDKKAALKS